MAIPADVVELPEPGVADETLEIRPQIEEPTPSTQPDVLLFPNQLSVPRSSHP